MPSKSAVGSVNPTFGVTEREAYFRVLREELIEADIEEVKLRLSAKRLANSAVRAQNDAAMR